MSVLRIMLDTNIYDQICARRDLPRKVNDAHHAGKVLILCTHIQQDEIAQIPDEDKRAIMSSVVGTRIATSGAAWGVSRWGLSTWGDGSGDVRIGDIATSSGNHVRDGLIASTDAAAADVLVTEDQRLQKRVCRASSTLEVWDFQKFVKYIEGL